MPRKKITTAETEKRPVESCKHRNKKRVNTPLAGFVTPATGLAGSTPARARLRNLTMSRREPQRPAAAACLGHATPPTRRKIIAGRQKSNLQPLRRNVQHV